MHHLLIPRSTSLQMLKCLSLSKPVIKLGILGGDGTLHNFVCGYAALKIAAPKLFDGLDIQCFMLPGEHNDFSSFLAKFDGWYGRHIYFGSFAALRTCPSVFMPSTAAPTTTSTKTDAERTMEELKNTLSRANATTHIPKFKPNDTTDKKNPDEEDRTTTPALVYRCEIENYLREAKCRLEVHTTHTVTCQVFLYQCECWSDTSYFTIPFCQRVELGLKAFTRAFQVCTAACHWY